MTLQELSVDHDYYASENNYYSNDVTQHYYCWDDFYSEMHDADVDLNLVFRWDIWKEDDSDWYSMQISIIQQRKGIYAPFLIDKVEEKDVPEIEVFLKPHFEKLITIWQPLSERFTCQVPVKIK